MNSTETTKEKAIQLRLQAAQEAQQRTRLALFALIVVSITMITAGWNGYLSWYRSAAFSLRSLSETDGINVLQAELLREWVRSRMINISLLGIKVGVDDAPQLGALTLFVTSIWFFFSTRRENYTIGYLLRDTRGDERDTRWMIFHGVISFSVFTNISNVDKPIKSIKGPNPRDNTVDFARPAYRALYFLPSIAIAMLLIQDVLSVFVLVSPFREPQDKPLLSSLHREDIIYSIIWWTFSIVFGLLTSILCWKSMKFSMATEQVLTEYWNEIRPSQAKATDVDPDGAQGSTETQGSELTRSQAYELWEQRGRPLWDDRRDWFEAEEQIANDPTLVGSAPTPAPRRWPLSSAPG
jgi:Protein of unknown function (DUF2934)